jgi:hypothetical protein
MAPMSGAITLVNITGPLCRCVVVGECPESSCGAFMMMAPRRQGHYQSSCAAGAGSSKTQSQMLQLHCSMTQAWQDWRSTAQALSSMIPTYTTSGHHGPMVVDDLGGQYEETFDDVHKHLVDYFTYKAVKTVLAQLSEMNPLKYAWFYNFVVNNKPQDSKLFLRVLVKEKQELGERVMVTRLHLFNKWVKKYNHAQMHKAISDQNLELLRERLIQTVKLTSDGDDIDRPPLQGM